MKTTEHDLQKLLDGVLPRLRSDEFLKSKGLGNEIAFYVFDYPAEHELKVRKHIAFLIDKLGKDKPPVRVQHIDLLDVLVGYLQERGFLEKVIKMERDKGGAAAARALEGPLHPEKFAKAFVKVAKPDEHDALLVSGVGSVYPLIRTHQLLNNLHALIPSTPVVFFYPGTYDGKHFHLFGRLAGDNYYRAFKLVS